MPERITRMLATAAALAIAAALGAAPAAASAQEPGRAPSLPLKAQVAVDSGTCGTCVWFLEAGNLVIAPADGESGVLEKDAVDGSGASCFPWRSYADEIIAVKVESGVSSGGYADCLFDGCTRIESIDLSGLDASEAEASGTEAEDLSDPDGQDAAAEQKWENPMQASAVAKTVTLKNARKLAKAKTLSGAIAFDEDPVGAVTYARLKKGSSKWLSIARSSGRVTVKKGAPAGTYRMRVAVRAAGNEAFDSAKQVVTVEVAVAMKDGWQKLGGKKYYYRDGKPLTGKQVIGNKGYYFNKKGVMQTGICKIDGHKYYLDKNGVAQTDCFRTVNGKKYYFRSDGIMATIGYYKGYLIAYNGVCHKVDRTPTGDWDADARRVASLIAKCCGPKGKQTDKEYVARAACYVSNFCTMGTYTVTGPEYYTAYGVFIAGKYSCAGGTAALGLVLDYLGYSWEHVNKGQWTHQWCRLTLDGKVGYADACMLPYGTVGYGLDSPVYLATKR